MSVVCSLWIDLLLYLSSVYGITGKGSALSTVGVFEANNQSFSPTDLATFQANFGLPNQVRVNKQLYPSRYFLLFLPLTNLNLITNTNQSIHPSIHLSMINQ